MKLDYIQIKTNVASILWAWGNGFGMNRYPVKTVYKGHTLGNTIWICQGDVICFAADKTTKFGKLIENMHSEIIKDPAHVTRVRKIFEIRSKEMVKFISFLKKSNFSKFSNKKLYKAYQGIENCYKTVYPYGEPIAFTTKDFGDFLEKYLKSKGARKDDFHTLITSPKKSFMHKEQTAMLRIALKVKGKKITPSIKKLLEEHTESFTWLPYDYGANHFTLNQFTDELKRTLRKDKKEIQKELNRFENYSSRLKRKHNLLFKKYSVNKRYQNLFNAVQTCYYLMDRKKEIFTMLHWYSLKVFGEIKKRLKAKKEHVQYILPTEMKDLVLGKKNIDKKMLEQRFKACVLIVKPSGKADLIEGIEAKKIADQFFKKDAETEKVSVLAGRGASPGNVRGPVRIIMNAKKCDEMKDGDILVTSMTSPDFMIAIKKARAIITDEGGITCHAAIISREMGIPCVIGVKNATKMLKTGEIVEVRGCHGFVELIERK